MANISEEFPGTVPEGDLAAEQADRLAHGALTCSFQRQGSQWIMLTVWGDLLSLPLTEFFPGTTPKDDLTAEMNDRKTKGAISCRFEQRGNGWVMYTDWGDVLN